MAEPIQDKIKRSLQAAEGLYYRLVLLVGETGSCKTSVLRDVAKSFGTEVINVNLALSAELLELTSQATGATSARNTGTNYRQRAVTGGARQP